jgi:hypothetical protein
VCVGGLAALGQNAREGFAHFAMAFAAVVQILCEGNVPCPAVLFWPGMLLAEGGGEIWFRVSAVVTRLTRDGAGG